MYQFEKVSKKLLGSQVEDELMNYILQEPIEIGQKIPNEFELAEMFGVGRSTIREAVKGLVSKGILEVRRGSGTFVISTYTMEDDPLGLSKFEDKFKLALELFDVRLMIEPEIAALACDYAEPEEKERLNQEVTALSKELSDIQKESPGVHGGSSEAYQLYNAALHCRWNQIHKTGRYRVLCAGTV